MDVYLPVMLKSDGLNCLIAGGGKVALRKVIILLRFNASVTVVSPEIEKGLFKLHQHHRIKWKRKKFAFTDLFRRELVVAATDDKDTNRRIFGWARIFHIPCNSVDNPDASTFIFPAIYKAGQLTIAISTQGQAPFLARKIRKELAGYYGKDFQEYIDKLSALRQYLKVVEPDFQRRKKVLNKLANLERREVINTSEDQLKGELQKWLSGLLE